MLFTHPLSIFPDDFRSKKQSSSQYYKVTSITLDLC